MEQQCGMVGCHEPVVMVNGALTTTCAIEAHQDAHAQWKRTRKSNNQRIRAFLFSQVNGNMPKKSLNRIIREIGKSAAVLRVLAVFGPKLSWIQLKRISRNSWKR